MTITFNPILLEDPKFKALITNKEMLSIYRTLPEASVENVTFKSNEGNIYSSVIYSFIHQQEAIFAKQAIMINPPYKDIRSATQERNLLIVTYTQI